jgi:hypothetical protein
MPRWILLELKVPKEKLQNILRKSTCNINTIGIKQANKVMHLSATAYNLKKYLKFITKTVQENVKSVNRIFNEWIIYNITSISLI